MHGGLRRRAAASCRWTSLTYLAASVSAQAPARSAFCCSSCSPAARRGAHCYRPRRHIPVRAHGRCKAGHRLLLFFVTSSPALVLDKYPTQWTNIGCVGIESWGTPRASHAAPPGCPVPFDGQQMCTYMGIDRSVAFRSFRARRMLRSQRLASAAPPCRPKLEARHRLLPCFPGGLQSKLASLPRLLPCSPAGSQSSGASGRGATVARRQARSRRERTPLSCACLPQARGQQSQR